MKISRKLIEPTIIVLLCLAIVISWFQKGLLFAGGEESLMLYDPHKTYTLFNSVWYNTDTGYQSLVNLARLPYFWFLNLALNFGFSNVQLQSFIFFILLAIGSIAVYFLIKETVVADLELKRKELVPLLSAIFYIFNPFSMSQIWGRGLTFQFFSFALMPAFLLFFVLGLRRRKIFFGLLGVLLSFFLSAAYAHPALVLTSWFNIALYFLFYLVRFRKHRENILFAISYFFIIIVFWIIIHSFWIYPTLILGNQLLENSMRNDGVEVLQGVSMHIPLHAAIRLVHNGVYYVDRIYGNIYQSFPFLVLSWFIPLISLLAINIFKKCKDNKFYTSLFLISLFIGIGSNFPTGWILIWLFKVFPLLQVLRNPYEKFGINLLIAYIPFFTIGIIVASEKISIFLKTQKIVLPFITLLMFLICVIFIWPMWNGSFAGGYVFNPWVKVPEYYKDTDNWLNSQKGDFKILQIPLIPGDGVKFTWEHNFQGIEPSEYIFSKTSIGKDIFSNRNHYSVLLERFGKTNVGAYIPGRGTDNLDFKDDSLAKELAKLDVKYIVLHHDVDWKFNGSVSPQQTEEYLKKQPGISKDISFGKLDIYKVEFPENINLIFSPQISLTYKRLSNTNYQIDIKEAIQPFSVYFLEQFDDGWEAFINSERIIDHYKVFSFANAWNIDQEGDYTFTIRYQPQEVLEEGLRVTKICLISLFITCIGFFLWSKIIKFF